MKYTIKKTINNNIQQFTTVQLKTQPSFHVTFKMSCHILKIYSRQNNTQQWLIKAK